jgi:Ca2+/H+ antiporter, TMEM165/GDT1 family
MVLGSPHLEATRLGTTLIASFLASLVECVEALTVVLAVGSVRGWRSALTGCATALLVLTAIVAALGPALTRIPLHLIQLIVGTMILLFGLRWLRKAILRFAGLIPLHDEQTAFAKNTAAMRNLTGSAHNWDKIAFTTAFNITMLEGTEVVFIVIALGTGGTGLLLPAAFGAVAALLVIVALGFVLHRPLARVPENTLKFIVGVLLSAFGTFWVGEGAGLTWPGVDSASSDLAIPCLMAAYLAIALCLATLCRNQTRVMAGGRLKP